MLLYLLACRHRSYCPQLPRPTSDFVCVCDMLALVAKNASICSVVYEPLSTISLNFTTSALSPTLAPVESTIEVPSVAV